AFSGGPKSCIGQRFAPAESTRALASLIDRYELSVPEDLAAKPIQGQKWELLKWEHGVTITPTNSRVRLRRR
ncbi:hypothetical protein C8R44DRAFT_588840, partial [Mycena epipterygia]